MLLNQLWKGLRMRKLYKAIFPLLILLSTGRAFAQQPLVNAVQQQTLDNLSISLTNDYLTAHAKALALAKINHWPLSRISNGRVLSLQGVNALGMPVYLITHNNTDAATTTGTNQVQPGGSTGLNLSGSSSFLANK